MESRAVRGRAMQSGERGQNQRWKGTAPRGVATPRMGGVKTMPSEVPVGARHLSCDKLRRDGGAVRGNACRCAERSRAGSKDRMAKSTAEGPREREVRRVSQEDEQRR